MIQPKIEREFDIEYSVWTTKVVWDEEQKFFVACSEYVSFKIDTDVIRNFEFELVLN